MILFSISLAFTADRPGWGMMWIRGMFLICLAHCCGFIQACTRCCFRTNSHTVWVWCGITKLLATGHNALVVVLAKLKDVIACDSSRFRIAVGIAKRTTPQAFQVSSASTLWSKTPSPLSSVRAAYPKKMPKRSEDSYICTPYFNADSTFLIREVDNEPVKLVDNLIPRERFRFLFGICSSTDAASITERDVDYDKVSPPWGYTFLARLTPRGTLWAQLCYLLYGNCMRGVQFFWLGWPLWGGYSSSLGGTLCRSPLYSPSSLELENRKGVMDTLLCGARLRTIRCHFLHRLQFYWEKSKRDERESRYWVRRRERASKQGPQWIFYAKKLLQDSPKICNPSFFLNKPYFEMVESFFNSQIVAKELKFVVKSILIYCIVTLSVSTLRSQPSCRAILYSPFKKQLFFYVRELKGFAEKDTTPVPQIPLFRHTLSTAIYSPIYCLLLPPPFSFCVIRYSPYRN